MYKYNVLYLNITNQCNLACKYCYVQQASVKMPLNVAMDAIDFLFAQNTLEKKKSICFFGGEPLLLWDEIIIPCILYTKKKYTDYNLSFTITTNGTLLDKKKIDFIINNNIKLVVSMDGNKLTQNYNRPFHSGEGSYDNVYKNILLLHEQKYFYAIRSIIYSHSCNNFFNDFLYLSSYAPRVIFMPDFFHSWNTEEKNNLFIEIDKLSKFYINEWSNKNSSITIRDFDVLIRQHYNINQNKEFNKNNFLYFCKCGTPNNHHFAVSPNGNIYVCQDIVNYEYDTPFNIGNIYTGFNVERQNTLYQYLQNNKKQGDKKCEECEAFYHCKDSCIIKNYFTTQNIIQCPNFQCEYNRYMYNISKNLYNQLKNNIFYTQFMRMKREKGEKNETS